MNNNFIIETFVLEALNTFKKTGWFEDYGNVLHNIFVELGSIGNESYKRYFSIAKDELKKRYSIAKYKRTSYFKDNNKIELNPKELEGMAKKFCVNEFLKLKTNYFIYE